MAYLDKYPMRYHEVTEAPVADIEVHGMDRPGTYPDADRKLLMNPAHLTKIRKHFEKTPYIFNLYFHNFHDRKYISSDFTQKFESDVRNYAGLRTSNFIADHLGIKVPEDHGAISVVFLSNANVQNSIPMTPWIVAHRFAHALTDASSWFASGRLPYPLNDLLKWLTNLVNLIPPGMMMRELMTTRSARSGRMLTDWREELIAQYLMQGAVRLHNDKVAPTVIASLTSDINDRLAKILTACVGHIFVTI